jgi:hypothetical protein
MTKPVRPKAGRSVAPTYNALMPDYRIRQATVSDALAIAWACSKDMGELELEQAAVVESASRARLVGQLASGEYVGWLAEADVTLSSSSESGSAPN